jgi:hypothetical protein
MLHVYPLPLVTLCRPSIELVEPPLSNDEESIDEH